MTARLGIDFGGTGIKAAIVDTVSGALLTDRFRLPTPQPSTPDAVAETVAALVATAGWDGPAGFALPGVVIAGIVRTAANIDDGWLGADAPAIIGDAVGSAITALNDADAAGIAEASLGAAAGRGGVVLALTFGTGIGSAVLIDGALVPNTEFGQIEIDGRAAERSVSAKSAERDGLTYEQWARRVNRFLAKLETLMWPDVIVIGGGISKRHEEFLHLFETRAEILPARLQNNAGIVGAAIASIREHA